ncbi:type II secretion system F family protein [Pseudoteredinibacter isoporae]|uniref:MSHA biogenesis protein MshG n=1 Tax=Pseudoteredinibacter isoporae TaxID=570281 RepID=A0A7X0JU76_9GAMM|nr:type II secretion system F family protein [Pseudoteredinibacter isoporae]MBB6522357.1 MSHA biogenesis protein MshG [Pseudoteredinibacter isoporae]NHO87890.1 type II secretion system F family protein [Pseudoteredinibacter isoporae]NIB23779.1 type II secretion system F family protein [Pseudoteredinibacter isoporae]
MASFSYIGRSSDGQKLTGSYEAANAESVASRLAERGIIPLEIHPEEEKQSFVDSLNEALGLERVEKQEIIMFARQMYTISRSGIPLIKAIRGLASTTKQRSLEKVLLSIVEQLESGSSLANALRRHPTVFDNMFVSMVDAGENSGQLEQTFKQIAEYIQQDIDNRKRVSAALRYPSFVVIALSIAIAVVNIKVIPAFAEMYQKFNAQLPWSTKLLIGMSDIFVHYWPHILAVIAGLVLVLRQHLKTDIGKRQWGRLKLRLPIIGSIIQQASMARYARGLALMLRSGVPINQSLGLVAAAMDNLHLSEQVLQIRRSVERGDSLLQAHGGVGIFTPLVLQMIAVGEESGRVEELLDEVALFYEEEVDYDLKRLSAKIEPIMIVVMAAFVMVLALGIFLPMWDMLSIQTR